MHIRLRENGKQLIRSNDACLPGDSMAFTSVNHSIKNRTSVSNSLGCTYRACKAGVLAKRPAGREVNSFLPIRLIVEEGQHVKHAGETTG